MTTTQPLPATARVPSPRISADRPGRVLSFIVLAPEYPSSPEDLYQAVRKQTEFLDADWEIVFIDHSRCEKTWLPIQSLVRDDPAHVRALHFSETQNTSAALALGYREAKGDLVFTLQADQRDDPRELPGFLQRIGWENLAPPRANPNERNQRWQNILPRGVLCGPLLSSARAA